MLYEDDDIMISRIWGRGRACRTWCQINWRQYPVTQSFPGRLSFPKVTIGSELSYEVMFYTGCKHRDCLSGL